MKKYFIVENVSAKCSKPTAFDGTVALCMGLDFSITYYSMNPVDDCSAYYLVAKRCWGSKWSDPVIDDSFSVKRVLLSIQISMCKGKATIPDKYQL